MPDYKEEEGEAEESMIESMRSHCNYLKSLSLHTEVCKSHTLLSFLEVSNLTFNIKDWVIYKEGPLKKRSGGRHKQEKRSFLTYCGKCRRIWKYRWFILTDQYLAYMRDCESENPIEIMLIDSSFHILYGKRDTGNEKGIIVVNNNRKLRIKARDHFEWRAWLKGFNKAMKKSVWGPYSTRKFGSFAPQRKNNYVKHFIDGKDYFSTLNAELWKAEREIFITDWWLSPEMYLKRPISLENEADAEKHRLDYILKERAEAGVKIFILVWKEVELAGLYNASTYVKTTLMKLHKNIKVIRHPRTLISMWSHHEKIVVIDQAIAFLGGLDICYGRWDMQSHPLKDLKDKNGKWYFPGLDYSNSRVKDFTNVSNFKNESIDRNIQPRMPWHDVSWVIYGESAQDLARHFIEYWNHAKIDYEGTKNKQEGTFLKPIRKANYNNSVDSQTFNQVDSSDSEELIETSDQGILGKGLESISENNEEDKLEESESKVYAISKPKLNKARPTMEKRLQEEEDSKIEEVEESEEIKEEQEEEDKEGDVHPNLKNNDSINEVNEEESEGENDHPSSEDRESDYLSDDEEDKNEEEDKVFEMDNLKVKFKFA
jgi:phospholipase D1/2